MPEDSRRRLVAILRLAYSGELAAAYAYRGHWRSLSDPIERDEVRNIEHDEWHHRELVGALLASLGARPHHLREARAWIVGRILGMSCHLSGWLAPMYGAGRLERRNIGEYETAAQLARDCGELAMIDCLLGMAEVEWDHEQYFRAKVRAHRLGNRIPIWSPPPPKASLRSGEAPLSRASTAGTSDEPRP